MSSALFRILFPRRFSNGALLSWGTVGILGVGIGIFLSLQILFADFYGGLMEQILQVVDEVSIRHNPLREKTEEEEDDEFFSGRKSDPVERAELAGNDIEKVCELVSAETALVAQPVVRIHDCQVGVKQNDDSTSRVDASLIFADWHENGLAIFDSIPKGILEDFTADEAETIPILAPNDWLQGVSMGEEFEMDFEGGIIRCRHVGLVPQNKFAGKMIVLPFCATSKFRGNDRATEIAVMARDRKIARSEFEKLKIAFEDEFGDEFIVSYWEDSFKKVKGLFHTMNFLFSVIISSIFVIAFFFAYTSFNILIERKRKQLAIALAIGCKPAAIRSSLLCVASLLGGAGIGFGMLFAALLLNLLRHSWVREIFASAEIVLGGFRLNIVMVLLLVLITAVVMLGSAFRASRRVFAMNPMEDIRV